MDSVDIVGARVARDRWPYGDPRPLRATAYGEGFDRMAKRRDRRTGANDSRRSGQYHGSARGRVRIDPRTDPGNGYSRAAIQIINTAASVAPLMVGLDPTGRGREWLRRPTAADAMSAIARDAIELLTGPTAHRVKECANPECEIVFVDTSPPGARRWCAMGRCGNLLKNRDYRSRRAAVAAPSAQ